MAPDSPLRLRAEDTDDLAVISAVVQDALISINDLTYDRNARRFTLVANRFRWEAKPDGAESGAVYERTLCSVVFDSVDAVTYRGFRRRDAERFLSLLAIRPGTEVSTIDLAFAGDATLRLIVSNISIHATDLGEAWPTSWQPDHNAGDPA